MHRHCAVDVRHALSGIYGAVAAVLRDDQDGLELMLHDASERVDEGADVLVTIALATIDRLRIVASQRHTPTPLDDLIVLDLVITANSYELASRDAVAAAVDRISAVHAGARARTPGGSAISGDELLRGAIAILTAAVEVVAAADGRPLSAEAADLCLWAAVAALA